MRPYTPLELAGRNIYVREGCYLCHSQMIRSLRDEVERYGHFSLAAESMYDHPFQWGSKRNGPDLARVGGKYTDAWHVAHLTNPRSVVPQSIMPTYALPVPDAARHPRTRSQRRDQPRGRRALHGRSDRQRHDGREGSGRPRHPRGGGARSSAIPRRWCASSIRRSPEVTEGDAVIAYLQMLGTLVDFKQFDDKANLR